MSSKWRFVDLWEVKDSASVVEMIELNGVGRTEHEIEYQRFCTADIANPGYNYPLVVPIEGQTNRSFWKTVFLRVAVWPVFCDLFGCSAIKDICIFSPEESVFGPCSLVTDQWQLSTDNSGGVVVGQRDEGDHGMPIEYYSQATGIDGASGNAIEVWHPYYCSQEKPIRKLDCFTAKKPCVLDRTIHEDAFDSKAMVVQLILPHTAVHGQKPMIEFHWGAKVRS